MKVERAATLPDVLLLTPARHEDRRGSFQETWREERYAAAGLPRRFVQDNVSISRRGVLRGLHLQWPAAQGKLVYVLRGAVFDVAVDVRRGSPTFGRWAGHELSADNRRQAYVPEGFAHGFVALSAEASLVYKNTAEYDPACELTVRWDDPAFGIDWPVREPVLSDKDASAPALADIPADRLPVF